MERGRPVGASLAAPCSLGTGPRSGLQAQLLQVQVALDAAPGPIPDLAALPKVEDGRALGVDDATRTGVNVAPGDSGRRLRGRAPR